MRCVWRYGYFSYTAGEHLKKQLKTIESCETNQCKNRFQVIMQINKIKQFHFTDTISKNTVTTTCSKCKQTGHNRQNKSCHMHPVQPRISFPDSDDEL